MPWYCLFVKTGYEFEVKYCIKKFCSSNCNPMLPQRKLTEKKQGKYVKKVKLMFPGYVLVETDMTPEIYYEINGLPKIIKILFNGSFYSPIPQQEMKPILRLVNNGEIIDYSKVYIINSKVFVDSGPLKGMEGYIKKIDKRRGRAKILIGFMGVEKTVDIGIELLRPEHSPYSFSTKTDIL